MSRLTIVSHRSSIKGVNRGERGGERGERQLLYVEDLCVGYVKSCIDVGGTRWWYSLVVLGWWFSLLRPYSEKTWIS